MNYQSAHINYFTTLFNVAGANAFSSVSLRNQFMETQIFQDLMSESVFDSPSRCSSASLEGSASPYPAHQHGMDYCASPDSSSNSNNNNSFLQQQHANLEDNENSYSMRE